MRYRNIEGIRYSWIDLFLKKWLEGTINSLPNHSLRESTHEKQKMNIITHLAYPGGNLTSDELMKKVQQDLNLVKQK